MNPIHRNLLVHTLLATFLILSRIAFAEIAPVDPKELVKRSTHIVSGKVLGVYSKPVNYGKYLRTEYVAEVRVEKSEKGDGVKSGSLIYVRYWTQDWKGLGQMPPGTRGYWNIPKEGEQLRIPLVRKSRDHSESFHSDSAEGGYDVLAPNGFNREP
jgi:hypothetical protein